MTSGCGQSPPAVVVGSGPDGVAVDQQTDTIDVANSGDNTVSVIDGASCNATDTSDCTPTAPVTVGDGPAILAVDQATHTVYVPNLYDNTVSVIDGAKCNATVTSSCGATPPTVTVGNSPYDVAVDQATHTVYVANSYSSSDQWGSVSVINGATCNGQVNSDVAGRYRPPCPWRMIRSTSRSTRRAITSSCRTWAMTPCRLSMVQLATPRSLRGARARSRRSRSAVVLVVQA